MMARFEGEGGFLIKGNGAQRQIRTADTTIFNRVLYQLSYPGTSALVHRNTSAGWKRRYGEAKRAWQGEISLAQGLYMAGSILCVPICGS